MIKHTDTLRRNNIVLIDGKETVIESIGDNWINISAWAGGHGDSGSIDYEWEECVNKLEFIPLSEEWLLRADAIVYEFDNGQPNQYRIGERLFVIRDGVITDYGSSLPLKYVHTFQNFMFIMTSEELTFKEL